MVAELCEEEVYGEEFVREKRWIGRAKMGLVVSISLAWTGDTIDVGRALCGP